MMRSSAAFAQAELAGSASSSTQAMSVVRKVGVRIVGAGRETLPRGGDRASRLPQRIVRPEVAVARDGEAAGRRAGGGGPGPGWPPPTRPARLADAPRPEARWAEGTPCRLSYPRSGEGKRAMRARSY